MTTMQVGSQDHIKRLQPSSWAKLRLQQVPAGLLRHDLVVRGIPVSDAWQVVKALRVMDEDLVYRPIGLTRAKMLRRALSATQRLSNSESDRLMRLLTIMNQAIETLGSQEAAERWILVPALSLDQRKAVDLLQTIEGTEAVSTLLGRMNQCVYT